jgi:hypothetical protein
VTARILALIGAAVTAVLYALTPLFLVAEWSRQKLATWRRERKARWVR